MIQTTLTCVDNTQVIVVNWLVLSVSRVVVFCVNQQTRGEVGGNGVREELIEVRGQRHNVFFPPL